MNIIRVWNGYLKNMCVILMLWVNEMVWYFGKEMERNVLKLVYVIYEKVLEKVFYGLFIVFGVCLYEVY